MKTTSTWLRLVLLGTAFDCAATAATAQQGTTTAASIGASVNTDGDANVDETALDPAAPHPRRLEAQNGMDGSTGLLRMTAADSGAAGTFRFSLLGSYFRGMGALCPTCETPNGTVIDKEDTTSQIATRVGLSVTPAEFLEAYASLLYQNTSSDASEPRSIQLMGNSTLGVKGFMPTAPDRILSFGGSVDTMLLSSAGGSGIGAANLGLRAIGTADFTRQAKEARFPLRLHANVGYVFDNSGSIADDIESSRQAATGTLRRITRIERFAHDIRRVDMVRTGLGVEGVFEKARPFAEWSLDVPVNRQGYTCDGRARRLSDGCLSHVGFAAVPSRLTIGARVYPWFESWLEGLSFLAAFDIGTGATSRYMEEVKPELPWAFQIGLGWSADTSLAGHSTAPPRVVEKLVTLPPPPEHIVEGTVVQTGKGTPVAGAIVRYANRPLTAMVTDDQGIFRSAPLEPGQYRFTVSAEGFRDGECTAAIVDTAAPAPAPSAAPAFAAGTPAASAPAMAPGATAPAANAPAFPEPGPATPPTGRSVDFVRLNCELEALPRTAILNGVVRNADTTEFVEGATVTITDPLGRELSLRTDAEGSFRFANVLDGKSKLVVEANGYLRGTVDVTMEPRKDLMTQVLLHPRPKTPSVRVTKTEVKLTKEIHFLHGSAEILPDSMAILEEAADAIRSHPEITQLEIQGHTDDSGTPDVNFRLSTERANAVRNVLVAAGVEPNRLTARGYGQEKPLVPNTSVKNRAKNRRVQLMIAPQ